MTKLIDDAIYMLSSCPDCQAIAVTDVGSRKAKVHDDRISR